MPATPISTRSTKPTTTAYHRMPLMPVPSAGSSNRCSPPASKLVSTRGSLRSLSVTMLRDSACPFVPRTQLWIPVVVRLSLSNEPSGCHSATVGYTDNPEQPKPAHLQGDIVFSATITVRGSSLGTSCGYGGQGR